MKTNIVAKYDCITKCYDIPITIGNQETHIKFDPGASSGVISLLFFREELTEEKIQKVISFCEMKENSIKRTFSSSAGKNDMTGYLVDAGQISVDNIKLDHLYYYFIPQNGRSLGLLGNDFLHCCKYSHEICGDIIISEIDTNAYYNSFMNAISGKELTDYIDNISEEKDGPSSDDDC